MNRSAAPGRPRVALWGAGIMAGAHAAACTALGWQVVGVASRTPERAAHLARTVDAPAMTYGELLELGDVDLAIISTPPADHLGAASAWSVSGVPAVVSTPLAATLAEADALVELDTEDRPPLLFGSNLAVAPAVQEMFGRVGGLGPLTSIHGRSIRPAPDRGGFLTGEWAGGVLLHPGVHHLTLFLLVARLARLGAPVAVAATLDAGPTGDVDDHARIEVTFDARLTAAATISWRGGDHPIWDLQLASESGVLLLDFDSTWRLEHDGELVATPVPRSTPRGAVELAEVGLVAQLDAFWTGCRAGRRPVMNMAFGRAVLDLTAACARSAGLGGRTVTLPFDGPRDRTPLELWRQGGRQGGRST